MDETISCNGKQLRLGYTTGFSATQKDSGNDPDVTGETLILSAVSRTVKPGITIDSSVAIGGNLITRRGYQNG